MLNFGFIGLGQAGGRIVDTFLSFKAAPYVGLAINTATNDLDGLTYVPAGNRFALKGNAYGAGRTPEIAKSALVENAFEVGEKARDVVKDSEFVWLVAGLGGGTGTGCLEFMLEYVDDIFEQKVGLIVTIPRDDDGAIQKINAVNALRKIQEAIVSQKVCAVLIVDNDRFYQKLAKTNNNTVDWRDLSNQSLVKTIHELNSITLESGTSNFDRMDLMNFLSYSGCLAIGRTDIRKTDMNAVIATIRDSLTDGYFSSGYRFNEAKSFSTCFTLNNDGQNVRSASYEKAIINELQSMAPSLLDTYFGYYSGDPSHVLTIAAGLGLPDRVFDLTKQIEAVRPAEIKSFDVPEVLPNVAQLSGLLRQKPATDEKKPNPFTQKQAASGTPVGVSADNPFRRRK